MGKLWESFKSDIPDMISKFNNIFKTLGESANAEQFASIMEMKEGQQDIRKTQLEMRDSQVDEQVKQFSKLNNKHKVSHSATTLKNSIFAHGLTADATTS